MITVIPVGILIALICLGKDKWPFVILDNEINPQNLVQFLGLI